MTRAFTQFDPAELAVPRRPLVAETLSLGEAVLDELTDAVIALSESYRITYVNPAAERLYGFAAADVTGKKLADVMTCRPEIRMPCESILDPLARLGFSNGRATHVTPSGREIPVRVSVIHGRLNSHSHCVAIISDDAEYVRLAATLEERVQSDQLLLNLSARFSSLAEEQIDGEIELWLRRLAEMLGVDRSTFAQLNAKGKLTVTHSYAIPGIQPYPKGPVDKNFPWIVRELSACRPVVLSRIPDDLPTEAAVERQSMTERGMRAVLALPVEIGHSLVCVLSFTSFRGERAWGAELISRLQLAGSVFANAIVRRTHKRSIEQKQHELAHVGRVAAMGELAAVIAHELDQPLTAVVSNAQAIRYLLENTAGDHTEVDEALDDIVDSAMRLSEIVKRERRLLSKSEPDIGPIDCNEAIRDIELFIRAEARQHAAKLVLKLLPGLPLIKADRIQLQQVVLNLTRNGFQAMNGQPQELRTLTIRTASQRGQIVLTIADSGPPIEDAQLEQMFEPFFSTKANGLGMGLSISKSIVESHRGRIWATRNATAGITLHIAIPRLESRHVTR